MTDCFVRTVQEEGMKALFKVGQLVSFSVCSMQPSAVGVPAVQLLACQPCCSS